MIIDELGIRDLDEKDELLWKAMKALSHTVRELNHFPKAGNYGDAATVLCIMESYFGVGAQDKKKSK